MASSSISRARSRVDNRWIPSRVGHRRAPDCSPPGHRSVAEADLSVVRGQLRFPRTRNLSLALATLLTGYDLNKPKDYTPLFAAIKSIGGDWWHHLDSTWLIKSESTAARTTPW